MEIVRNHISQNLPEYQIRNLTFKKNDCGKEVHNT